MSYTSINQNYLVPLFLILLAILSLPQVSYSSNHPLNVELESELSFSPTKESTISDHDSEITLSYETEIFEVETSSDFDLEKLSETDLILGVEKEPFEAECELVFDPQVSELESYGLTGDIQLQPETSLELEYESDYPRKNEGSDVETVLTLDHDISEDISFEIEGEFSETDQLKPLPSETNIDLSGLETEYFILDTELEFDKANLGEIGVDLEGTSSLFHKSGPNLELSINWELSENFVELEPEFDLEFGKLSLETSLRLKDKSQLSSLELTEASLDDLNFFDWEIQLSNDFESGETEVEFDKDNGHVEIGFELEVLTEETGNPIHLSQMTGELTWHPNKFLTVTVESELYASSSPELCLTSEYEF